MRARSVERTIVATDSVEIIRAVESNGGEAVLTSKEHRSGSDRIAEVAESLPTGSIIVNVQGDEPLIHPRTIDRAVGAFLADHSVQIVSTSEKIDKIKDVVSPDTVKVVTNRQGYALYFSRSPIPFPRESVRDHGSLINALRSEKSLLASFRKHTGLYVYSREYLLEYTRTKPTRLEQMEQLEQMRALESGARIRIVDAPESSIGVDTREDFERVKAVLENRILQIV